MVDDLYQMFQLFYILKQNKSQKWGANSSIKPLNEIVVN